MQTLVEARRDFERHYIADQLREHGCNIARAAKAMGTSRTGLHRMMHRLGIAIARTGEITLWQ
jgi:transcriptional regulator with GAF, ATPase, and Fis domain